MKRLTLILGTLAVSAVALAGGRSVKPDALAIPQSEVKWMQPYGPQGPAFGFVDGSFGVLNHPASFFAKFPSGADSGWHIHDEDYEAVVLKGTLTAQQQGEAEVMLPPGTYFTQVAKKNHRNGCTKDADCLLYVHFARGASTHPTTPDGKLVPMPAPAKR
jgi:quercetin dioxygenase-like cupin family protein